MAEGVAAAAALLVVGPLVAAISAGSPALIPYWSASREDGFAIVRAHRLAWTLLNAGFILATVTTAAGLGVLALALDGDAIRSAALATVAIAYTIAGGLWCAVQAIRARTTPALADLAERGAPTEPSETLVGAAIVGLFTAFTFVTGAALVALGVTLALAGGIAFPAAVAAALVAAAVIVAHLNTGDSIPAVLYLPTLIVGIALLLGWT